MSFNSIPLSLAKRIYSNLPHECQLPSLNPGYVHADSCRATYLQPTYWTYSFDSHFSLRSFHQVSTELPDHNIQVHDIEYPYGYGGVLTSTRDPLFLSNERKCFREWATNNGILLEFCRLHPLLPDQRPSYELTTFNREVVSIDLTTNFFDNYRQTVRNSIRKDRRKNIKLVCSKEPEHLDLFLSLYTLTMKRLNSSKFYHFSRDYFLNLLNSSIAKIWSLSYDQIPQSAAITLENHHSGIVEYYLGAYQTLSGAQPMLSLLDQISLSYASKGYKLFYLGGGRSPQSDDSLLRFKQGLANRSSKFYIGTSIFNNNLYSELKYTVSNSLRPDRVIFYRD